MWPSWSMWQATVSKFAWVGGVGPSKDGMKCLLRGSPHAPFLGMGCDSRRRRKERKNLAQL